MRRHAGEVRGEGGRSDGEGPRSEWGRGVLEGTEAGLLSVTRPTTVFEMLCTCPTREQFPPRMLFTFYSRNFKGFEKRLIFPCRYCLVHEKNLFATGNKGGPRGQGQCCTARRLSAYSSAARVQPDNQRRRLGEAVAKRRWHRLQVGLGCGLWHLQGPHTIPSAPWHVRDVQ